MKKKLLITGSTFPRYENDTEPRFLLDYAISMSRYADVTVLVPAYNRAKKIEKIEGINVIRYHYFPIHSLETLCYPGAIVARIRQKKSRIFLVPGLFISLFFHLMIYGRKYDIVHANWLIPQGIVQSFFKKPYYVTGHGGDVTSLNKGIMLSLKRRCLRKAKGVVGVSKPLADMMTDMYDNPNSTIIPMGCDISSFGENFRIENYFNQKDKSVILFVGRLAEKKGTIYAIEAMEYIENAVLVIVGEGTLSDSLKKKADFLKKKKGADIRFLGAKTHEELKYIYASADVFVMPSITAGDGDKEGLGLVILEAFASGIPVVAFKSGGIVDLIKDGKNGFLVKEKDTKALANKINMLLNDRCIYDEIKENATETAKGYDYTVVAKKYAQFMGLTE